MSKLPLYLEIAYSLRKEIVYGSLKPDDTLPTIRETAKKWECAPGTALRAYQELSDQGLVVSRPGAGTVVASDAAASLNSPLRRATLINKVEAFLLQVISAGYSVDEIKNSFTLALDRYKSMPASVEDSDDSTFKFMGSHDPSVTLLASRLAEIYPEFSMKINFVGSLGGLLALARGEADIAGAHLWDSETNQYNRPFVHRIFPGKRVVLLRLAERRIGLIIPSGNPLAISELGDLSKPGLRFINRQEGAGTRVWLEAHLQNLGVDPTAIQGYTQEAGSHAEVASAVLEDQADVGLGIETAALGYGLGFLPLTKESYDLVIPEGKWDHPLVQMIFRGLKDPSLLDAINMLGGYDTTQTGDVEWVG